MSDRQNQIRERFANDTASHELKVIRDDGLYRHLRCSAPGTWTYGYDIVTWPGYLAIVGDAGDFVFSRIRDMFEFFESDSGRINPDYWDGKLQAPRPDAAKVFSEDSARAHIFEWLSNRADVLEDEGREWDEQGPCGGKAAFELYRALQHEMSWAEMHYEDGVRRFLQDFEYAGHRIEDAWEWDMREFDWQFLWCCYAIVWAIGRYRALTPAEPVAA